MADDGKIIYKVELDDSGFLSEAEESGRKAGEGLANAASEKSGKFENVMIGAARRVGEAFVEMAASSAQAVAGFIQDSVSVGAEFETSMSQIAATLGYSSDEIANNIDGAGDSFAALKAKAEEMGAATNYTATQAAEGLNILAMSGYDAEQSIAMIEDVLHLASAGSMDMAASAGFISGAMKGFNDETKDSAYYADLMAKGATLANTNVSQLGEALSGSAAVASSYGQSADSVTVALLRLAEQGETGSAAATALSAAMKNLYAPTDQAKELLTQLGVSAFDPVSGKARDFNDVVNELDGALSGYSDEQRTAYAQTIFGIQGFSAYNKMVVTSADKQEKWAEALAESSGEAANQYDTMTDNLQGDLDILNSAMDGFKLGLYEKMQEPLRGLVQFGSESVTELSTAFKEGGIEGLTQAALDIVSGLVNTFVEQLPQLLDTGLTMLTSLIEGIASGSESIFPVITNVLTILLTAIVDHLPDLLMAGVTLLGSLIAGIANALPALVSTARVLMSKLITGIFEKLPDIVETGLKILKSIVEGISKAIPVLIEMLPELIKLIVDAFSGTDWLSIGQNIVNGIWDGINMLWDSLVTSVGNAVNDLLGTVAGILGIASPSKKFRYIGQMTVLGTMAGMEDEEANLTRTVTDIYSDLPEVAGTATRHSIERSIDFSARAKTPDTEITVPLYLDGREVARATAWSMGEQLAWEEM